MILCHVLPAGAGVHDRLRPRAVDRLLGADPDGRPVDPEAARVLRLPDRAPRSRPSCGCRSTSPRRGSSSRTATRGRRRRATSSAASRSFVMGGDFVIGIIVFLILVTVNFLVITKGATRIAEVGARFTLDAIPGKQMAIDADLSAGLIDDKEAQRRRRELEEESAFFGSMDGASKFVRGDAIAGLIILAVNIFGGIVIGVDAPRHAARRRRRRLHQALGRRRPRLANPGADRLARRRPAGLQGRHARLGRQGGARPARQLSARALRGRAPDGRARRRPGPAVPALRALAGADGLRRLSPFRSAGGSPAAPRRRSAKAATRRTAEARGARFGQGSAQDRSRSSSCSASSSRRRCSARTTRSLNRVAQDAAQIRARNTASSFRRSSCPTTSGDRRRRAIRSRSTAPWSRRRRCASASYLVIIGDGRRPDVPGEDAREPAFGMKAIVDLRGLRQRGQARGLHAGRQPCRCCSPMSAR